MRDKRQCVIINAMPIAFRRLLVAALLYAIVFSVLALFHDYPQLRAHLQKVRQHNSIAEQRQWLQLFYFVNEAGSGIKFFFSSNEKYMYHYPSPSHVLASRKAQALKGNWKMQMLVAHMHRNGEFAPKDLEESLRWLYLAREHAPSEKEAQAVEKIIKQVNAAATQ